MFCYKGIKESALNTYGWKSLKHLKWFVFLLKSLSESCTQLTLSVVPGLASGFKRCNSQSLKFPYNSPSAPKELYLGQSLYTGDSGEPPLTGYSFF